MQDLGISVTQCRHKRRLGRGRAGRLYFADIDDDGLAMLNAYDEGDDMGAIGLTLNSNEYGSKAFVSVTADGEFAMVNADGDAAERENGMDVNARINGIQAIGNGLKRVDQHVQPGRELHDRAPPWPPARTRASRSPRAGPSSNWVRTSSRTSKLDSASRASMPRQLGGDSGQLYQLRSGGVASLSTDTATAAKIVDEAIVAVTTLRGRLGAFQKTTLETNIAALSDTLEALTDAESSIRDADFAAESANLTRAQILVQSGTSVLAMANQNPQNVLALLR